MCKNFFSSLRRQIINPFLEGIFSEEKGETIDNLADGNDDGISGLVHDLVARTVIVSIGDAINWRQYLLQDHTESKEDKKMDDISPLKQRCKGINQSNQRCGRYSSNEYCYQHR